MLQRQNNFADIDSYFVLGKMFPLIQMRKQLAAADIICKKAKFSFNLGLDNILRNAFRENSAQCIYSREIIIIGSSNKKKKKKYPIENSRRRFKED